MRLVASWYVSPSLESGAREQEKEVQTPPIRRSDSGSPEGGLATKTARAVKHRQDPSERRPIRTMCRPAVDGHKLRACHGRYDGRSAGQSDGRSDGRTVGRTVRRSGGRADADGRSKGLRPSCSVSVLEESSLRLLGGGQLVGQESAKFGPSPVSIGPHSIGFGQHMVGHGRTLKNLGPSSANVGPTSTESGEVWSNSDL